MRALHYELEANLAADHWWWAARRQILEKVMGRLLEPGSDRDLLEVGCGSGFNLPMLENFGRVEALEMSPEAVAHARARMPATKVEVGVIPMELDRLYDVICLFDVLEHIEDEETAVQWIHQHLRPGGRLFLTVPAYRFLWSEHDVAAHHFRRYTRSGLIRSLGGRFAVDYATYFNTHLFPVVAVLRLLRRGLGLKSGDRDASIGVAGPGNAILRQIFSSERFWLPTLSLPFGVSILLAARKES